MNLPNQYLATITRIFWFVLGGVLSIFLECHSFSAFERGNSTGAATSRTA